MPDASNRLCLGLNTSFFVFCIDATPLSLQPGTDESFRGYIAEIIGFARFLTANEESEVQNNLDKKYQNPKLTNPPADYVRINDALETAAEVFKDNRRRQRGRKTQAPIDRWS